MEIKIKPTPGNMCTRVFCCTICGGSTDKTSIHMTFTDPADGAEEFVCEPCVARGPDAIKKALLGHADRLRSFAEELCRLSEADFVVPTSEETDRVNYEHDCLPYSPGTSFADYVAERGFEEWKHGFLAREAEGLSD